LARSAPDFSTEVSERLRRQLEKKIGDKPPLTSKLKRPDTKGVKPDLKAKIAYRASPERESYGTLRSKACSASDYRRAMITEPR
jgi:hypothetical protein